MLRTYKFKLYRSKRLHKLERLLNIARSVYNHCIALQRWFYKLFGKNVGLYRLQVHITKMKRMSRYKFWNNLNSQVIQDVVERVCRSYKSFFSNYKKNKNVKPPNFRSKHKYRSVTFKQTGYKFLDNVITLQKKFRIKFCKSREIEGKVKTVTFKRNLLGDWYVYVVSDVEANEVLPRLGETIGLDFGLKHFLTINTDIKLDSPPFFKQMYNTIRKLNRSRSRKIGERKGEKKSKNWLCINRKLKRAYERLTNLRDNFQWKLVSELCSKYSVICIENLNLKGMQKLWGRKISELRFGEFVKKLEYVATKFGCTIVKVGKWFASSQICSNCGHVNPDVKDLRLREWGCPCCGKHHDRDVNAAINIKNEGLRILQTM